MATDLLAHRVYEVALELLTEATVNDGFLAEASIQRYSAHRSPEPDETAAKVRHVLHVLEHDGYLTRSGDGYRFVSSLVEEWWRRRHATGFVRFAQRLQR